MRNTLESWEAFQSVFCFEPISSYNCGKLLTALTDLLYPKLSSCDVLLLTVPGYTIFYQDLHAVSFYSITASCPTGKEMYTQQ